MIALVIIGLAAVIAIGMVWSRVGLARSERRSMQNYRHSLDVLGGVSKKSGQAAPIKPVPPERASLGHIRAERPTHEAAPEPPPAPRRPQVTFGQTTFKPAPAAPRAASGEAEHKRPAAPVPPVRAAAPVPPPPTRIAQPAPPTHFEDDSDAFEKMREEQEAETVVAFGSRGATEPVRRRTEKRPSRQGRRAEGRDREALSHLTRRVGTMAAVAVVLAAVSLGAIQLAGGNSKSATGTTTKRGAPAKSRHHHHASSPTTTTPSGLVPVSTSPTEVAFVAPKGKYTVKLSDTGGTCWVGIQQTTGGPYVWQETLYAGQGATYKASGPLVIRIGAPRFLGVTVNGLPARLPGFVQPYDVVFNPASPPSAA